METSKEITVYVAGGSVRVVLDERVLPDRTTGQVDSGWWAWLAEGESEDPSFFVSDDGTVWSDPGREIVGSVEVDDRAL